MPRKKTIQPLPIKTIKTGRLIIEIRDKDTREIGRGQDKKFNSEELDSQVLNGLLDMYLSGNVKNQAMVTDLLEAPRRVSKLARQLELWGYELSDRSLREHAKKIRLHWAALMSARQSVAKKARKPNKSKVHSAAN